MASSQREMVARVQNGSPGGTPPAWAYEPIGLADPDPAWANLAHRFASEVRDLLDGWLTSDVVHIGSTAIPGLPAKPIIDLQATADTPASAITSAQQPMIARLWFFVPRDLDQRPWRWFVVRADPGAQHRLAHLHLMRTGERRWQDQIIFRDRLRAAPALATEYAALKARAADEHTADREAYSEAKAEFVRRVLV